jgi:hypothetical protein
VKSKIHICRALPKRHGKKLHTPKRSNRAAALIYVKSTVNGLFTVAHTDFSLAEICFRPARTGGTGKYNPQRVAYVCKTATVRGTPFAKPAGNPDYQLEMNDPAIICTL